MNQAKKNKFIGRPRYPGSVDIIVERIAKKDAELIMDEWMTLADVTPSKGREIGR
jgi:hypothetical protein